MYDTDGTYANLNNYLHGEGVYSVEDAKRELSLTPLHNTLSGIFEPHLFNEAAGFVYNEKPVKLSQNFINAVNQVVDELNKLNDIPIEKSRTGRGLESQLGSAKDFTGLISKKSEAKRKSVWLEEAKQGLVYLNSDGNTEPGKNILVSSLMMRCLVSGNSSSSDNENYFNRFLLDKIIPQGLQHLVPDNTDIYKDYILIKTLSDDVISAKWKKKCAFFANGKTSDIIDDSLTAEAAKYVLGLFNSNEFRSFIGVHEYEQVSYFNKEKFEEILDYIYTLYNFGSSLRYNLKKRKSSGKAVKSKGSAAASEKFILDELKNSNRFFNHLRDLGKEKGYRLGDIIEFYESISEKKNVKAVKKKVTVKKPVKKKPIKKRGKGV